jgi:hypothetical protein
MLMSDADRGGNNPVDFSRDDNQNFPDRGDNHGRDGGLMNFCDGHVEWVSRIKWLDVWDLSQDTDKWTAAKK